MPTSTGRTSLFGRFSGGSVVIADQNMLAGNVWFVGSTVTGATDGTSYGRTPDAPFKTLNYAITQVTASNGDVIILLPGHVETIIAAAGVTANVAGVRVIGVGQSGLRPKFSFTTVAGASFDVSAANFSIENCHFDLTGVASLTAGLNITAADFTIKNCRILQANATNQAALGILTTAAANRMLIDGCMFHGTVDAVTNAIQIVGGDAIVIQNNRFIGGYATGSGAIQNLTTACTGAYIFNNYINNLTASCTKAMIFNSASTGQISENKMQILSGTAPITGAAMSWVGANYYGATIGQLGVLI